MLMAVGSSPTRTNNVIITVGGSVAVERILVVCTSWREFDRYSRQHIAMLEHAGVPLQHHAKSVQGFVQITMGGITRELKYINGSEQDYHTIRGYDKDTPVVWIDGSAEASDYIQQAFKNVYRYHYL